MAFQLKWSIEGEQQLARTLRGIGNEVKDWKPAFKRATDDLKRIFSTDVFNTEGREIGESWPKLKPQYLAAKRGAGFVGGTLVKTGRMQRSFKTIFKSDFGAVWNSAFYFKYHQSNKPRIKIPRRVMIKLGNQQKEIVVKVFQAEWLKKINRI